MTTRIESSSLGSGHWDGCKYFDSDHTDAGVNWASSFVIRISHRMLSASMNDLVQHRDAKFYV